jgi:hypothetical protein
MANRSIESVPSAFKRQAGQNSGGLRRMSNETADKLFMAMMRDQSRFGTRSAPLSSQAVGVLVKLRNALRRR